MTVIQKLAERLRVALVTNLREGYGDDTQTIRDETED